MNPITRVRAGEVHWEFRADVPPAIKQAIELPLAECLAWHRAHTVKNGLHRTVYELQSSQAHLYLKHYKTPDISAILGNLLRSSQGWREWHVAQQLASRGIATARPIAIGHRRQAGVVRDSYLVTEAIPHAQPLNAYVETLLPKLPLPDRNRFRHALARQLAEMIAEIHQAGVRHSDLHAGNFLVEMEAGRPLRLFLIDLHSARLGHPLSRRAALRSLAQLNIYFFARTTRSDRHRFFVHYMACRPGLVRSRKTAARAVERRSQKALERFWRRREKRCLRPNRHFFHQRGARVRGSANRQIPEPVLSALMRAPDRFFRNAPASDVMKNSDQTQVVRIELPEIAPDFTCVLKRYAGKGYWHDLCRTSPARRAWKSAHALLLRGISTAEPLAMVERLTASGTRDSYLLTRAIENGFTLNEYAKQLLGPLPPAQRQRAVRSLIRLLALFVRRLHEHRFDQRDLKAPNILIVPPSNEPPPESLFHMPAIATSGSPPVGTGPLPGVFLLDLDGLRQRRHLTQRRRVQNLARLHASFHQSPLVTRSDKLRFLKWYLPGGLRSPTDWKRLWRRIARQTIRKVRRNERQGRCIA